MARTEVERRGRYLDPLERENHCCLQLIKDCLHNTPSRRPTAEEIVTILEGMKERVDGPFGDVARADAVRQVVTTRTLAKTQTVIREQVGDLAARDEEIRQLQLQIEVSVILYHNMSFDLILRVRNFHVFNFHWLAMAMQIQ